MERNPVNVVSLGAMSAFIAVACGAFGAHALGPHLDPKYLETWKTGVLYHLIHALALVLVGALGGQVVEKTRALVGRLFLAGQVIFGGSLYALALTSLLPTGPVKWLGAITPLGGVCFLTGWALLAFGARRTV